MSDKRSNSINTSKCLQYQPYLIECSWWVLKRLLCHTYYFRRTEQFRTRYTNNVSQWQKNFKIVPNTWNTYLISKLFAAEKPAIAVVDAANAPAPISSGLEPPASSVSVRSSSLTWSSISFPPFLHLKKRWWWQIWLCNLQVAWVTSPKIWRLMKLQSKHLNLQGHPKVARYK